MVAQEDAAAVAGQKRDLAFTYHLVQPKDLLALVRQVDLSHGHFPALVALPQRSTHGPADDLVAEADAHRLDAAALNGALGKVDQVDDPRVALKRRVAGAGDEHGVDVVERGVRVEVLDDVVARDGDELLQLLWRVQRLRGSGQQRCEDARVAAVPLAGLRLRRVGLEDGKAEW